MEKGYDADEFAGFNEPEALVVIGKYDILKTTGSYVLNELRKGDR